LNYFEFQPLNLMWNICQC